jgi:hypothetical protein
LRYLLYFGTGGTPAEKYFGNNNFVITIAVPKNTRYIMKRKLSERRMLEKDLLFYLRYYQKVAPGMQAEFDYQIKQIIERLKELPPQSSR